MIWLWQILILISRDCDWIRKTVHSQKFLNSLFLLRTTSWTSALQSNSRNCLLFIPLSILIIQQKAQALDNFIASMFVMLFGVSTYLKKHLICKLTEVLFEFSPVTLFQVLPDKDIGSDFEIVFCMILQLLCMLKACQKFDTVCFWLLIFNFLKLWWRHR